MSRLLKIFFLGMAVIFLNACSKKVIPFESDGKMSEFAPSYAEYDFINAKAKVIIEEESGKITRGTLSLRAKKDSVLWFTISPGMGMEAVRGLI